MPVFKCATVCLSNMNRSMEGHKQLYQSGFKVSSYGVGRMVTLPGEDRKPNVFEFGTSYKDILAKLEERGLDRNEHTWGKDLRKMLERNTLLKRAPQRWQDNTEQHDVVITFDDEVYDMVLLDLHSRHTEQFCPSIVINRHTRDNAQDASEAALEMVQLCTQLELSSDIFEDIGSIVEEFQEETKSRLNLSVYMA